jgi:hypothetical protein
MATPCVVYGVQNTVQRYSLNVSSPSLLNLILLPVILLALYFLIPAVCLSRGLVKKEWEWTHYSANTLGRVQLDMVFFKVVPIELYALGPTCLPVLEDVLEPIVWHRLQNRLRPLQNGRWGVKTLAPQLRFQARKQKKSHGARSGLYGGCGTHSMFFRAKYWATTFKTWGRALSWCRRQRDGCSSGRFRRMCSSRVFKTVM